MKYDKARRFEVYRSMKKEKLFRKALELAEVVEALLEYIDAIPEEVAATFPTMPGISRDEVECILDV